MSHNLSEELKNFSEDGFKKIVNDTQKKVRNICYRFLNNRDETDDVAQEVYIEVFQSLKDFNNPEALESWIYRIAVSKSIDHIRYNQRKKRFGSVTAILKISNEETGIDIPAQGNPQSILEDSQRDKILYKTINLLPENQKIALILNKIEGFTNNDIAKIMGTSINSVDSFIFKGKKKLKKLLTKYYSDIFE